MTDGDNPTNPILNTYAAELSAINTTLASNPLSVACPQATFAGSSSQAAVNCYLSKGYGSSITDFARDGLDSSNAFCGPFPCSVLGKVSSAGQPQQAAFGGANPAVGSNVMYFPSGRSLYTGFQLAYHTVGADNPARRVRRLETSIYYTFSKYKSNIAEPNGSGGDYCSLNVAENYDRPHRGYWGDSGLGRSSQLTLNPTLDFQHGLRLSWMAQLASPLPLTASVPQQNGGGVAGEIFRSDQTGDGTVGDLLPATYIGSTVPLYEPPVIQGHVDQNVQPASVVTAAITNITQATQAVVTAANSFTVGQLVSFLWRWRHDTIEWEHLLSCE